MRPRMLPPWRVDAAAGSPHPLWGSARPKRSKSTEVNISRSQLLGEGVYFTPGAGSSETSANEFGASAGTGGRIPPAFRVRSAVEQLRAVPLRLRRRRRRSRTTVDFAPDLGSI